MKITDVSCTQFAGIRDRNIRLTDGINVIYGKNESGKSTIVNLLSRTLFQNAKIDGRKDKDFFELYFPSAKKDSKFVGDFVDGKVRFETENGTYTLSKEWGSDSRCTLSTPDGIIRDQHKIDEILKEELLYGEGVYSDMLFSSQHNTDISLQTILDASQKTDAKQEITNAVSQAFAESDGVSLDAIEQAINDKINEIVGNHWNFERDMPCRKTGRWSNGLGEILKAYYDLEDAEKELTKISNLESDVDRAVNDYTNKDKAADKAEKDFENFNKFATKIAVQSENRKNVVRLDNELSKITDILVKWPQLDLQLKNAKSLQNEKQNRDLLDKYESAKAVQEEIKEINKTVPKLQPTIEEIHTVETAQSTISSLENKLCGMNLNAVINMLGDNSIEITSLLTGEKINITGDTASVTEAVKITVPGVMEMQLTPANVDINLIETQITEKKKTIADIFTKYMVENLSQLKSILKTCDEAKSKLDTLNLKLSSILGDTYFEDLEVSVNSIDCAVRSKEEISSDISALCTETDISVFIAKNEATLESYVQEYGSRNSLKVKADTCETELKKAEESVNSLKDIPAEYRAISDPENHLKYLKEISRDKQNLREEALKSKIEAETVLESYKENLSGDPASEFENAKRNFEKQKSLLNHWKHIQDVFIALKENIQNNPMQDIADRFTHYLMFISDGKISSEFPEADKLNMNIYSNNNLLDYGKLSEGTKETVSLAFRLAVLDHLFPNGGGVIVFDDPFTDMDVERTAQSCELIKECAKKHQVIFLTCKEDYLDMLGGNKIQFENLK